MAGATATRREAETLGTEFARALAVKDFERLTEWFEDSDDILSLEPSNPTPSPTAPGSAVASRSATRARLWRVNPA